MVTSGQRRSCQRRARPQRAPRRMTHGALPLRAAWHRIAVLKVQHLGLSLTRVVGWCFVWSAAAVTAGHWAQPAWCCLQVCCAGCQGSEGTGGGGHGITHHTPGSNPGGVFGAHVQQGHNLCYRPCDHPPSFVNLSKSGAPGEQPLNTHMCIGCRETMSLWSRHGWRTAMCACRVAARWMTHPAARRPAA